MRRQQVGSSLDLLEHEDLRLRAEFGHVRAVLSPAVEQRAEYGELAKSVIGRVATREAALVDVAHAAADVPELEAVSDRLAQQSTIRRQVMHRVEKMSRRGITPNPGQDFSREFTELMQIVGSEIEWDLDEAVPALRQALERRGKVQDLTNAHTLATRTMSDFRPRGSRRAGLRSHRDPGGRTRDQLYQEACKKGVRGRSKMNKAQLERALSRVK